LEIRQHGVLAAVRVFADLSAPRETALRLVLELLQALEHLLDQELNLGLVCLRSLPARVGPQYIGAVLTLGDRRAAGHRL
jgi:hypothetical protein